MYRAFVATPGTITTHGVPHQPGTSQPVEFKTVKEAKAAVERYVTTYATSFSNGYKAFILDWDLMTVQMTGEKIQPPPVLWTELR